MDNKQLKAILMALLGPQGTVMNINDQNFGFMERNADEILNRCGLKIETKTITIKAPTKKLKD